jgi:hypothetical protein
MSRRLASLLVGLLQSLVVAPGCSGVAHDDGNDDTDGDAEVESDIDFDGEPGHDPDSVVDGDVAPACEHPPVLATCSHGWCVIPAGCFITGSHPGEYGRDHVEERQRAVTLTGDFEMLSTEVTQASFEALLGEDPSAYADSGGDCPVEMLSWHDAAATAPAASASAP